MARQRKSVLDSTTQERSYLYGAGDTLPAVVTGRDLSREEQRTIDEYHKQRTALEVMGAKFKRSATLIAELNHHGTRLFVETADAIEAAKEGDREREHQAYIDEFCNRSKTKLANHMLAIQEKGAQALAVEAERPMYLLPEPPPPPKKRSVREWFLG